MTTTHDPTALARLVRAMREKQRLYFRTRSRDALHESISLERQVDDAISALLDGPTLFTEASE